MVICMIVSEILNVRELWHIGLYYIFTLCSSSLPKSYTSLFSRYICLIISLDALTSVNSTFIELVINEINVMLVGDSTPLTMSLEGSKIRFYALCQIVALH